MDSGTIRVYVIDDTTPEQDEAFYVNITSVVAFGASNITTPPRIGSSSYMQIIIMANDGTQGELAFAPKYQRYQFEVLSLLTCFLLTFEFPCDVKLCSFSERFFHHLATT